MLTKKDLNCIKIKNQFGIGDEPLEDTGKEYAEDGGGGDIASVSTEEIITCTDITTIQHNGSLDGLITNNWNKIIFIYLFYLITIRITY